MMCSKVDHCREASIREIIESNRGETDEIEFDALQNIFSHDLQKHDARRSDKHQTALQQTQLPGIHACIFGEKERSPFFF